MSASLVGSEMCIRDRLDAHHAGEERLPEDPWCPPTAEQLWQATVKCIGKAPGPDGWVAQELLALPEEAWQELSELLWLCEAFGWPHGLLERR
eukprot:12737332-Alexandrium_andersonii.AAC.1